MANVWDVGTKVVKAGGDYYFEGIIVSKFTKSTGALRVVVENRDGVLHIFNPLQLTVCDRD